MLVVHFERVASLDLLPTGRRKRACRLVGGSGLAGPGPPDWCRWCSAAERGRQIVGVGGQLTGLCGGERLPGLRLHEAEVVGDAGATGSGLTTVYRCLDCRCLSDQSFAGA